jgi:multicomponent Na+:H+ antiporter subunit G
MRDVVVALLIVAGVGLQAFACLGVVLMRAALDRLHFTGVSVPAAACLAAAVLVRESFSLIAIKALLAAALIAVTSPVLAHATARAIHARRTGGRP